MSRVRDEEIKRLEKYAYGLGITKITYAKPDGDSTGAVWTLNEDNTTELTFHVHTRLSKRSLILNFVHELAHHISWIYRNKQEQPEVIEALSLEDKRKRGEPPIPKNKRKFIYLTEKEDAEYREMIWKEVNIQIPIEYLHADIEADIWFYKQYYLTGHFPTYRQVKDQVRKSRDKYGVL